MSVFKNYVTGAFSYDKVAQIKEKGRRRIFTFVNVDDYSDVF